MPSRSTVILAPTPVDDPRRNTLANFYSHLWKALAENDYRNVDHFFEAHTILSVDFYLGVLRAIMRPMLVYVALSLVTSLEGLFIVSPTQDHVFYNGQKNSATPAPLRAEPRALDSKSTLHISASLIRLHAG
ncbi:hypothetical protein TNCV_1001641 [Trichonephila clavipes]|nr:hypothetical protein TNCV_1001641 [Trichonephila clavipes]